MSNPFEDNILGKLAHIEKRVGSAENAVTVLGDHFNGADEALRKRLAAAEQIIEEMKLTHIALNDERASDKARMDALCEQLRKHGLAEGV